MYQVTRGKLKGKKGLISAEADYLIDFSQNNLKLNGRAKALERSLI